MNDRNLATRVRPPQMTYCRRCVYPMISATPITIDSDGICSGCKTFDEQAKIDWDRRETMFQELVGDYKSKSGRNYDCVIPVSGGKDSFWQTHVITRKYGMRPLLVTYGENNETEVGRRNIQRMRESFGVDHYHFTPSIDVLRRMNKVGFVKMGDPDMHAHIGINTVPIQVAVKFGIPLIVWGEHGFMNLGGMHSYKDMVEYTKRLRKEHLCHGYDWDDFVGEENLTERDLLWAMYPDDADIERVGVRGIFISNFFGWNQNKHTREMVEQYGFELYPHPFDRTYRRDAALNNIHDNGIHDYMKFVKFGYGRASDHASRDIREGVLARDEAIDLVRQYDSVVPGDLPRWLEYVGMTRAEFTRIADGFRDPRVWTRNEYGEWIKDNIWEHN